MGKLNMTRRAFTKLAAATAAAAAVVTPTGAALAESSSATQSKAGETKRVRSCCRGCGKMECGVWVIVENGRAIRTEGDESAFHSMGNHCGKGQASLQAAYHPDRLYHPMKRTNARGEDDPGWVRISWDEAMSTIAEKLQETMDRYGGESIFGMSGTSRIWGMFAYGALGQLVGSPNMCIPWQVCKGPRFFATALNSMMQASWMETVGRPKVYTSWGTGPELSNYDDSCRTVVDVAEKADTHIVVDPRMTNLGKEADIWLNLRPGTDGAMAMGWLNVLINNDLYDDLFAKKWTDAPFLVCNDVEPSGYEVYRFTSGKCQIKTRLLKESDLKEDGDPHKFMVWDNLNDRMTYFDANSGLWEGETWSKPTAGHEGMQEHLVPGVSQGWVPDPTPFDPAIDPALYGEFEVELKDGRKSKVKPVWEYFTARVAEYTPEKVSEITGVPAESIERAAKIHATRIDPSTGYGNGGVQYQLAIEHSCNAIAMCRAMDTYIGLSGNWDVPAGHRGGTQGEFVFKAGLGAVAPGIPNISAEEFNKTLGIEDYPLLGWWQGWADDASVWKAIETGDPYPVKAGWCSTGDFMCMSNSLQKWKAFPNLDFFVCEELFMTETAKYADVILHGRSYAEKEGTFTNTERRVQRVRKAVDGPAGARLDTEVFADIMRRMGYDQPTLTGAQLMDEVASLTPSYAGISHARLDSAAVAGQGLQWPCTGPDHPGTRIMHEGAFSRGLGGYSLAQYRPSAEQPYEEFPLIMMTGRVLAQYNAQAMTGRTEGLNQIDGTSFIEINDADAAAAGIADGDRVRVSSRRGVIESQARVSGKTNPGEVWMPFHFQDGNANWLTNAALDNISATPEYKVCAVRVEKA